MGINLKGENVMRLHQNNYNNNNNKTLKDAGFTRSSIYWLTLTSYMHRHRLALHRHRLHNFFILLLYCII